MELAATLFDRDAPGHSATVEVLGVIFCAEDDGYAVLEVQDAESGEGFALVGPVAHLAVGDRAEVSGEWQTHARYGRQLRAQGALPLDPADREGRIAYLTSLRHIGPARAERLVDEHGEGVLGAIAADPRGVFASLRGVSADQAADATESWHASRAVRDLHVQLAPHGLAHLAAPIHTRFGDSSMAILHEDPYRLTEVDGVGFARADKIALAADVPPESSRRAQAAAVYALTEAEQQGNSYLPLAELTQRTAKLLGLNPDPEVLSEARGLTVDEGRIYRELTHASELAVAQTLAIRAAAPAHLDHDPGETPPQDDEDTELTDEQWSAVRGAFGSRISVLTGGPGVGKTACTRAIVEEAEGAGLRIALCAPTGRAARRLEEATGHTAQTIHRMLEWMPGREPAFKPGHPLPADLVIVDESSMLNLRLIEMLLGGLAESTHIVFVGDADQLPPIGAGKPFEDLIASGIAPVVRLTQIFRQAARSMITTAAHEINQGRPPHLEPRARTRTTTSSSSTAPIPSGRWRPWSRWSPSGRRSASASTRSATSRCWRRCTGGRSASTPSTSACRSASTRSGKRAVGDRFRIGDRLIQTRNSHELGLMNGSIVFLRADDPDEEEILVDTDEGESLTIPYGETATLRLAYAISVHKAQGCEVPVVVGVCHRSHTRMLTRPLLYTAITRARSTCVLVGDRAALGAAIRRDDSGGRHSGLAERLRG